MAKAIKWQIAFQTNDPASPTSYRIDIYAEGYSGTPIQLTAGPQPIVTEENNSDDFFTPVRSQTGTIQVCTRMPNGDLLDINDMLPADNIAHPVRLINLSNSNAIEWQGFMSCEAFSQAYTEVPEIFSFPVNSVLEAMASVELDMSYVTDIKKVRVNLYYILTELDRKCGMSDAFFSTIYYSRASYNFLTRYIDATILYSVNEYTNEENYTYVVEGMRCKDALERLCRYMGWVVRENGTSIYLNRLNDELTVYRQQMSNLGGSDTQFNSRTEISYTSANLSDQVWRGASHKRNMTQGAKSVEVVASLKQYELEMGLPEIPTDSLQHYNAGVIEAWATMEHEYNNMLTYTYYGMTVRQTSEGYDLVPTGSSDVEDAFDDCVVSPDCNIAAKYVPLLNGTAYLCARNCGAFVGRFNFSGQGETNWIDGLYIVTLNEMEAGQHAPTVFKMDSIINYTLVDGTLKLTIKGVTFRRDNLSQQTSATLMDFVGKMYLKLRFGNKYWNGSSWQTASTFFEADFDNDTEEDEDPGTYILNIPITNKLTGSVTLEIGGGVRGGSQMTYQQTNYYQPFYDVLVYELTLEHVEAEYIEKSDHSENKYYRLLGTNFREEVSVGTELASTLNNRPSPSLVLQDNIATPMRLMNYVINTSGTTEPRRPEVDLLNRLAAYYGAARQRLELEVKHPTAAPLPLLKLNGISPDTRTYLPLSEKRDWKEEVCTLYCFETPN